MPNNDIFSGIPSLDDQQGLENYLNQQTLDNMGLNTQIPAALEQPASEPAGAASQNSTPAPAQQPTYTNEQIAQIIARNQQLEAQLVQQPVQTQQQQIRQAQPAAPLYNERQIGIINQLLAKGVSIEQIAAHMANARGNASQVNNATLQRLQNIEAYLQQQQYAQAETEFTNKMLAFGEKFGLSEQELVHFGNVAFDKGINVLHADLETAFRAVVPDQYALRVQRMQNNNTSQFYGGASAMDTPRASASKMEDAYVDAFLKQSMPNQYGRKD